MAEPDSVDPRFDPVFQRGYDPAVHPRPAGSALSESGVRRSVLVREDVVEQSGGEVEPIVVPRFERTPEKPPAAAIEEHEPVPHNPWLIALVVVSVVLLAGAVGLLVAVSSDGFYYSGAGAPSVTQVLLQQICFAAPAPLLTVGLLGLVVSVALSVVWKQR